MPPMQPLGFAEASEENPGPPSTPPPVAPAVAPAPAPPRVPPPRQPVRGTNNSGSACGALCALFLIVAINAIYAAFLYGTIKATSEPLPRGIVNHTFGGFGAFQAFMYSIGGLAAVIDTSILYICLAAISRDKWPRSLHCLAMLLAYAVIVGFWIFIISLGWIFSDVVSKSTYAHACDSDWLEIVLTAHTWKTAAERNVATFSVAKTHEPLWTWTSNDPFQNDFNLVGLNSTNPSLLPSLSNVTINHDTNELERAWSYNTTNQFATGYVWPFDGLFFEVQFNGTLTRMRNRYNDWTFGNIPSVIMHRVDENGQLAERLMQTSVKNPDACKQIKVCVSHHMQRREGGLCQEMHEAGAALVMKILEGRNIASVFKFSREQLHTKRSSNRWEIRASSTTAAISHR